VVGNNSRSGVFALAAARSVPTIHLSGLTHPTRPTGDQAVLDASPATTSVTLCWSATSSASVRRRWRPTRTGRSTPIPPCCRRSVDWVCTARVVHAAVLASGVPVTGATVHLVTAEYDKRPILAQVEGRWVAPTETEETLAARVQAAERELLLDFLAGHHGGRPP